MTGKTAEGVNSRRSKDWRQRNPVVAPDRGFVKQLKMLDPEYEVVWDGGSHKWEIWRFPKDKEGFHIMTVQTRNKTYRELGQDILLQMQRIASQHFDANKIMNYLMESERQERRRKAKDFRNHIESIARETFNYARGVLQVSVPDVVDVPKTQLIEGAVKNG